MLRINDLRIFSIKKEWKVRIKVRITAPFFIPKIIRTPLLRAGSRATGDDCRVTGCQYHWFFPCVHFCAFLCIFVNFVHRTFMTLVCIFSSPLPFAGRTGRSSGTPCASGPREESRCTRPASRTLACRTWLVRLACALTLPFCTTGAFAA